MRLRRFLPVLSVAALVFPALAQHDEGVVMAERNVSLKLDGRPYVHQFGPRANTDYYSNLGTPRFATAAVPRWHEGDWISFAPENAGATNTLINVVQMGVFVAGAAPNGTVGDVVVALWELDPNLCDPTNGLYSTLIGAVRFTTPPLDVNGLNTIFTFTIPLDDVFPDDGGLVIPGEEVGIEYRFLNADDTPHAFFTGTFASNLPNPGNLGDPNNCLDPPRLPTVGSSDDLYARDADGNGVLTVGDANGCNGTPNELRVFTGQCPAGLIANFMFLMTFDPPPVANAGPDQSVNDGDSNGSEDVTLDGSGSTDDTALDPADFTWSEGASSIATGISPTITLAVGVHNITLTVADEFGVTSTDAVVVTVTGGGGGCPNPGCDTGGVDADFDGNCIVNLADLATLLANFGTTGTPPNSQGNTDGDNDIDLADLANLLGRFGADCN